MSRLPFSNTTGKTYTCKDVVVGDRGYNQARQWIEQADRGVGLVVRCNPQGLNLYDAAGQKMAVHEALNETTATERCLFRFRPSRALPFGLQSL